jgi:hypothetical protein
MGEQGGQGGQGGQGEEGTPWKWYKEADFHLHFPLSTIYNIIYSLLRTIYLLQWEGNPSLKKIDML